MDESLTPLPSQEAAIAQAMAACVSKLMTSSTVAIVGAKAPVVRQIGSGTLLAVADLRFVVTAAHVVREAASKGLTLGATGVNGGQFTALAGQWILTATSTSANDRHDVAIYKLDDHQIKRLDGVEFVRISDASFDHDLSTGYFVVTGFPGMWSTVLDGEDKIMKSKLLQYGTFSFSGSTTALGGYDATQHFLLEASPAAVLDHAGRPTSFRTRTGFSARMPSDLQGISGCSVWKIGDLTSPITTWTKSGCRIVGIETGVFEERQAIKATRWNAVTTLLYNAFPTLRSTIELYVR